MSSHAQLISNKDFSNESLKKKIKTIKRKCEAEIEEESGRGADADTTMADAPDKVRGGKVERWRGGEEEKLRVAVAVWSWSLHYHRYAITVC